MNFKQTSLESIPNDWEVVRLGEVGEIVTGTTPSTKKIEYYGGPYMFISPFDLGENKYVYKTQKWLSKKGLEVSRPLPKDTVLVVCIGSTTGKTGMTFSDNCATNQQINAIICHSGTISPFLYYMLTYKANYIGSLASKVAVPILNKNNFSKIKIPLPPFPEQQKIATVLSTIQRAIEHQDKIIETTRKLKKSLLHKLFTEGLNGEEQKETEIGMIPKSWDVVRLEDNNILTATQYGLSLRGSKEGKYPILRMNNLTDGYINPSDLQFVNVDETIFRKFRLEWGDILFNRTNSVELVGKTSIFNLDSEFVFASYLIRLKTNPESLNPYFLNFYLNWDFTQSRLKGLASRGVSQANISAARLKTLEIPLPSLEEQHQIAHILSTVDKKIEIEGRRKATLKELFKTMLHKLMTGEIRLKDVNI
ncbi:MAG: restriction endonuclease subunit S [Methanophagales archaeon]|nr:restriction endonuclease subunit S [Methanophagales archaeon]